MYVYLRVSESESGRSLLTTFCLQAMANQKNGDLKKGGIKGKGAKMACFNEWIKRGEEPRPSVGQIRIILTCKSSKATLIELMIKNREVKPSMPGLL